MSVRLSFERKLERSTRVAGQIERFEVGEAGEHADGQLREFVEVNLQFGQVGQSGQRRQIRDVVFIKVKRCQVGQSGQRRQIRNGVAAKNVALSGWSVQREASDPRRGLL